MLSLYRQRLIILRGAARPDRAALGRALASELPPRAAAVHFDDIASRWLVLHGDPAAEEALCYRLLKLICISLLKEGYTVIADAPFAGETGTQEQNDLSRLARTFRGLRLAVLTLLPEGDDAAAEAERQHLRHTADAEELLIAGSGGDIAAFARALVERLEGS